MSIKELTEKYNKLSNEAKQEVEDFIDFLNYKSTKKEDKRKGRIPGKAKGLIFMRDNFDDPIESFKDYM